MCLKPQSHCKHVPENVTEFLCRHDNKIFCGDASGMFELSGFEISGFAYASNMSAEEFCRTIMAGRSYKEYKHLKQSADCFLYDVLVVVC